MSENIDQQLEERYDNRDNARAGVTLRKYRNRMVWRRNKVRELLARGYHQDEIASTLHISQPTISRDIHYIQREKRKNSENYGQHLFEVYRNNLCPVEPKTDLTLFCHPISHFVQSCIGATISQYLKYSSNWSP